MLFYAIMSQISHQFVKKILVLALILTVLPLAAENVKFLLSGDVSLPSTGIRLKTFKGMSPLIQNPPSAFAIRNTDNARMYQLIDFWRFRQTAGVWSCPGIKITVGEIKFSPTEKSEPVAEKELDSKFTAIGEMNSETLKKWVGDFTGLTVKNIAPLGRNLAGIKALECDFDRQRSYKNMAVIIQPTNFKSNLIFICYTVDEDAFDPRVEKMINQSVNSINCFPPTTVAKEAKMALSNKNYTAEYQESRQRVIDNIKNLREWWYMEGNNFIFVSNQKNQKNIARLKLDLEHAREVYAKYFPLETELKSISVIKVFNQRDEYLTYVGKDMEWSGGIWSPAKAELVISPIDERFPEKMRREIVQQVVFHEGCHQYLFYALGERNAGMWFNEGAAQFFEGVDFRGNLPSYEIPEHHLKKLTEMFASRPKKDLNTLINMDRDTFYGADKENNYLLANALMIYLLRGCVAADKPEYSQIAKKYYEAIRNDEDYEEANQTAFEKIDMDKLSRDLADFWGSKRLIDKAEKLKFP